MDNEKLLEEQFSQPAAEHYQWQTSHPIVSEQERKLVRAAFRPLGKRVLDLGCGEGATLTHLDAPPGAVGLDLFEGKLSFARTRLPRCQFVQGSAYALPFEEGRFDHVLVRDVMHHLEFPERALGEVARVLEPGGRLDILEPCGLNPLVMLHALTHRVERRELRSRAGFLKRLVRPHFDVQRVVHLQPLPIHRAIYHPELGRPALANSRRVRRAVARIEELCGFVMPRATWAYVHLRCILRPHR